jgi:hypothetical protein
MEAGRQLLTDALDDILANRATPETLPSSVPESPLLTRSAIIPRSNSAKTPIIGNIAFPAGVPVSIPCWRRYDDHPAVWERYEGWASMKPLYESRLVHFDRETRVAEKVNTLAISNLR